MRQLTGFVAAMAAAVMLTTPFGVGTGTASADGTNTASGSASGSRVVPLSSFLRRCDWSIEQYVPSVTRGTGYAVMSRTGNTVTAEVHMISVTPDIWYGVRLVQVPRPGLGCGAGDPGVGFGQLFTDDAGIGTVTVTTPVMNGATGAWVSVEGPANDTQTFAGDFRTSDYIAPI
jgi:hypothetical protein